MPPWTGVSFFFCSVSPFYFFFYFSFHSTHFFLDGALLFRISILAFSLFYFLTLRSARVCGDICPPHIPLLHGHDCLLSRRTESFREPSAEDAPPKDERLRHVFFTL